MDDRERATGIDYAYMSYHARSFITTDARQNAFDNYESLMFSQSGLAGAMPAQMLISAQIPRGFEYTMSHIGIGGTPSPNANGPQMPLISQSEFATAFVEQSAGATGGFY